MQSRLRELRKSKGLTQAEFATPFGLAKSTYSNYEIGVRKLDLDFLVKVANQYRVSIDWLIGRDAFAGRGLEESMVDEVRTSDVGAEGFAGFNQLAFIKESLSKMMDSVTDLSCKCVESASIAREEGIKEGVEKERDRVAHLLHEKLSLSEQEVLQLLELR